MRIERINENSIKCTLTSFDLSVRNLNLRELAYGSDKAKKLFDEMMTKASNEVGFHVENTPIMIEAIPMSSDSIQLIISKVSDPEELDTRFSRFTQNPGLKKEAENWINKLASALLEGSDGLAEQIKKLEASGAPKQTAASSDNNKNTAPHPGNSVPFRAFQFDDLDRVIDASRAAASFKGISALYKSSFDGHYVLVIESRETPAEDFSRACNVIAEYGRMIKTVQNTLSYYEEHYITVSKGNAIGKLGKL
ncbi:MAG: adaptor protein MecA [Eubacteriales bacterium]|nr:adaptor protein MecA [Eubacteriales bacterium]